MGDKFISPDVWKSWERQGKSEFFTKCKSIVKAQDTSSPIFSSGGDPAGLTRGVYDLICQGMRGVIRKESTVSALEELVSLHCDISSMILDVFGVIDSETFSNDSISEERLRFCYIVKESEKFLSEKLLKERLEIDTLQSVGTLKNRSYYTKFIKVKTKLYYKQRKFNLFREESEGYAKLVVELNQEITSSVKPSDILEAIKSLIGCFNLDPNRVLDVILESFECRPEHHAFFIPLIRSYMPDPKILCEVLGFKFSFYQGVAENTPESLYVVTALMLQYGIISLDDIYCWLIPDDRLIQKDWEKELSDAKEYVRKLSIISIKDKDKEKEEVPEEKENIREKYYANQKFGLCEALLKVGDWMHTQQLSQKLPDHCLMEQPPIALATCQLLHIIIDPLYKRDCTLGSKIKGRAVTPLKNSLAVASVDTLLGLRDNAIPMLQALGPSLHMDPVLMYKILRICKAALADAGADSGKPPPQGKDTLYYDVITILDEVILPALSYMDSNCCLAEEVWTVIKVYPYQMRYCLYSRWKNDTYLHHAKLMVRRADAQKKIKSIMKRVSKENIKQVGRHIGKLTHCSPGFLFDYILLQVQLYDNLILPVVDSLKYLTSLSYDVLGCCLVETLAQADKDRSRHDGTSIASWLQSLSCFCGAVFKKYNIELTGLLQYVANQLKAQKSLDLLILKEIVQKMAGVEAAEEMTAEQLDAMAGGDLLKGEAGYFSQVRNTKKSSIRLKEALWEQNLAVALCLLMAQQRYCVVYRETAEDSHLKLVGWLYDQAQDTLVQFGTFLGSTLSMEEYVTRLPSIHSMLSDYHIHTDVAFFLARPMFNHAINLRYDALRKADPNCKKLSVAQKQQKYMEATFEVMGPIVQSVRPLHPAKVWEDVSPQFLVTFWSLTMYDLHVPTESYQREINKLKQLSAAVMDSKDMAASKSKKEQERYLALMEKLQDEKKKQQEHVEKVLARLKHEKDMWFLSRSAKSAKNETITQFLQLCLFPRCVFTMPDAMYCAKFVHTIHSLKTPNFSTLLCYDRLFCDITYSVTSCTENEANRYGRFLNTMLETVMRWHSNNTIFERECANYPGFVTKFRVSNQVSEACDHVAYENYRHVCHKWHYKITKAMVICLDSKDYVQIRNSLIILIKILPHFPVLAKLANIIQRKIEKVCEEEKNRRQDLYVLATSYSGQLKAKASSMTLESDFHQVNDKSAKNQESAAAKSSEQSASAQAPGGNAASASSNGPASSAAATPSGSASKQVNGDVKKEKHTSAQGQSAASATEKSSEKTIITMKDEKTKERRTSNQSRQQPQQSSSSNNPSDTKSEATTQRHLSKDKVKKEESKEREEKKERDHRDREKDRDHESEPKEKLPKKEERWEDGECHDKRSKEKKEERVLSREQERMYREERFAESAATSEERYSSERYYERERERDRERDRERERERDRGRERDRDREYYAMAHAMDDRELSSVSNSSSGSAHRRSQEPAEPDRDVKRRKMEGGSSSKSSKHEERKHQLAAHQQALMLLEQEDKETRRERGGRNKDKKSAVEQEEKELRKERKLGRKRDRVAEEAMLMMADQKKRKDEEKASKLGHQNGEPLDSHPREKHHYAREKSPYMRERERSHDRIETRDKQRTAESKRR